MKASGPPDSTLGEESRRRWPWLLFGGCLLVILIALLLPRQHDNQGERVTFTNGPGEATAANSSAVERARRFARGSASAPAPTAGEIVTNKVNQFARNRREVVNAIARKFKVEVPDEIERFFEAVEAGRWDEIE